MEEYIDDFIDKFRSDDRILELTNFAAKYNLNFIKRDRFGNQDFHIKGFKIFQGKRGKRLRGIIMDPEPTLPCRGRIYDYHYYSDGGKKKTTIIEIESNQLNLPGFRIRPTPFGLKVRKMFVPVRPAVKHPYFNQHYIIECDDTQWVRDSITEEHLDLISSREKITVEGNKNFLLVYYRHKRINIDRLIYDYEFALEFFELLSSGGDRFV